MFYLICALNLSTIVLLFFIPQLLFVGAPTPSVTEPWRAELQELAKAAGLTAKQDEPPKEEGRRTSQYSSATGRLIPPPTKAISRSSSRARTAQFLNQVNTAGDILGRPNVEDTVSVSYAFRNGQQQQVKCSGIGK